MPKPTMFNQYKAKKKRAVDPNAPPRPTLLGHEKTIKDMKNTNDELKQHILKLEYEIDDIRGKMIRFQQYLDQVHAIISSRK